MKKEYNGAKAEKVEFDFEQNVVASGNPSCFCGHFEGDLEILNGMRCPCHWVSDGDKK